MGHSRTPLLPLEPPEARGGRPRIPDRAALTGSLFVLRTGTAWELQLHADNSYDVRRCHAALKARRSAERIARVRVDSSARLGRYRCVVERTGAWYNRYRRLRVRDERRADIHAAFVSLASALILFNYLHHGF